MGFFNDNQEYIFLLIFIVLFLLLIVSTLNFLAVKKLKGKYNNFLAGKDAVSLEDTILNCKKEIIDLKEKGNILDKNIKNIKEQFKYCTKGIGVEKYNAFKNDEGNLSFSVAIINEKECGVIITALHASEGSYSYCKKIINGKCESSLSKEEEKALKKANDFIKENNVIV